MATDRMLIKTQDGNLILAGGRPRGTLYAVYTFLEDAVGCRWWTSTEEFVPQKSSLDIQALNIDYTPPISDFRMSYCFDVNKNPAFAAKLKSHGFFQDVKDHPEWGGGLIIKPSPCHTYYWLLPPKKYFAKHPEWYSADKNGTRFFKRGQLCETNPEMKKEMVRRVNELLSQPGNSGYITICPQDWGGDCQCSKCLAAAKAEGRSGPMVQLANYVAREVVKDHPNAKIVILPYNQCQDPPKNIQCAPNVLFEFCTSGFSMANPVNAEANKKGFATFMAWKNRNPISHFWVWCYNAVYQDFLQPFPNYPMAAANIKIFAANGVKGVMLQGDGYTTVGDFIRLRAWTIAHLLWNPELSYADLEKEFLEGYYGTAAPFLKAYMDLMENTAKRQDIRMMMWSWKSIDFLSPEVLAEGAELFKKASAAVKNDPETQKRVEREKAPLIYAAIMFTLQGKMNITDCPALGYKDCRQAIDDLERLFKTWKTGLLAENAGNNTPEERIRIMRSLLRTDNSCPDLRIPTLRAKASGDLTKVDWTQAAVIEKWKVLLTGEEFPEQKRIGRLAHDDQYLYLQFQEETDSAQLDPDFWTGDGWELFFASERGKTPCYQIAIDPKGKHIDYAWKISMIKGGTPKKWDSGAVIKVDANSKIWKVSIALPLDKITPNGINTHGKLYANFYRRTPAPGKNTAWSPNFQENFHLLSRLGELSLQ